MSEHGRGAKATLAQRAEVKRLRADGVPIRKISEQVFGDERYRGRVERILYRSAALSEGSLPVAADPLLEGVDFSALGPTAFIRLLYERRLASWAASGEAPSMAELRNMLEVQRRLESFEALERMRRLTRADDGAAAG